MSEKFKSFIEQITEDRAGCETRRDRRAIILLTWINRQSLFVGDKLVR